MRVASNTVSDNIIRQIQNLTTQQARLQTQVSTGQRISLPEDDPAAAGRVLNLTSERRQQVQYGQNGDRALALSQASFAGLKSLKSIADRAGELATLGTGTLGADAMSAYATETNQLIEQAVQAANTTFNGDYIYAGTKVDAPPFTLARNASGQITGVTYAGNSSQAGIALSDTSTVTPSTDGATNAGLGAFINNLVALRDALASGSTTAVSAAQPALNNSDDLVVSSIANNGGIQTRIEASRTQQTDRKTSIDALISSETSADLPATIVKLNQVQTAYQAALQSAVNIMNLSILDYIK
ncbi:MAG: flagellar hook-associated protein FlgL [Verrucomicrobia bacterium]|nr:flagellar hook-associated protein FlgL [Verrucomicrobiota bacterium]